MPTTLTIDYSRFCEGHESLRGDRMGATVTCDGTCSPEYRRYRNISRLLNGEIIDLGGDNIGIRFGGHYDTPRTPETDDGDVDGWYVASIEDADGPWIVTYEHKGDTGQREWVEVEIPEPFTTCDTADAFRAAGHAASKGAQL